jgi:hypothetical protein
MNAGLIAAAAVFACAACAQARSAEEELRAALPGIFAKAAAHYRALDAAATPLMHGGKNGAAQYPHGMRRGALDMRGISSWTSGHYAGSLWLLYEATGDEFFKERATAWTEILTPNSRLITTHDLGFMMYCSFGNARRLLKTDKYDAVLLETAASLSKRYNPMLGLIRSWGKVNETKNFLVIPDNMMNLELLEWAARAKGGAPRFHEIAVSHANVTMRNHFRADGGAYHVLNYSQTDNRVQEIRRGQGASCFTAWSRGQSWAIYGYTMMHRETRDAAYLGFAQKLADFAMDHANMPKDGVPHWDYGAPGEERDSSSGSIMASALIELADLVPAGRRARYRGFAVKQLATLASPEYFSSGSENGHWLLKHGVGAKPMNSEIDTPLNYGDYYFLEALLRFRNSSGR